MGGTSYPKGICSAALHCRTPSPTKNAGCRGGDGRGDVGIVPYRAAPGCPLQAQVAGHAGHGAAADADGHGAVLFIQDAAYL